MAQSNELRVYGGIKLYAGTASQDLARKVADYLGEILCGRDIVEFPNENLFVKLHSSVRGQDVYVIQHPISVTGVRTKKISRACRSHHGWWLI
jgi:phosphoribosylpyrophosphate synthetase